MRQPVRCLEIRTIERSFSEMERMGLDQGPIRALYPGQFFHNIKLPGLAPGQARLIVNEASLAGAQAAAGAQGDVILSGTLGQFRALAKRLAANGETVLEEFFKRAFRTEFTVEAGGRSWRLGPKTLIMGILNVTPDSFFDGGRYSGREAAIARGLEMAEEGADWIDVGGESTRPGAAPVSAEEEVKRAVPVIEALVKKGVTASIDTSKAVVASEALRAGASIINDVTALSDPGMAGVAADSGAAVVLMHMRGTPQTMQHDTSYKDVVSDIYGYLDSRIGYAVASGIKRERIIIDPGLGFGKSREGNIEIIRRLSEMRGLGAPVLIGASRKSFIKNTAGEGGALAATIAVNTAAILAGASIIRVHDVGEARASAAMADSIKEITGPGPGPLAEF